MMETLSAADGLPLHLVHWPAAGASRGSLLLVHGLGEHIGRYGRLAAALNRAGWTVHGFDQRGHGHSGGARGALAHPDALMDDLSRVWDRVMVDDAAPRLLLGHSMGGLLAARFVAEALEDRPARWSRRPDGLVLSSPALDPGMTPLKWLRLWIGERLLPDFADANGLDPAWVSRDPVVVRDYVADPLVHDRLTARLARCIVDAGTLVRARAAAWSTPTLLMWAGADRCVAPSGSAAMAAVAPAAVLEARPWPRLAHEIFNEPEREQVIAHLLGWLDRLSSARRTLSETGAAGAGA